MHSKGLILQAYLPLFVVNLPRLIILSMLSYWSALLIGRGVGGELHNRPLKKNCTLNCKSRILLLMLWRSVKFVFQPMHMVALVLLVDGIHSYPVWKVDLCFLVHDLNCCIELCYSWLIVDWFSFLSTSTTNRMVISIYPWRLVVIIYSFAHLLQQCLVIPGLPMTRLE